MTIKRMVRASLNKKSWNQNLHWILQEWPRKASWAMGRIVESQSLVKGHEVTILWLPIPYNSGYSAKELTNWLQVKGCSLRFHHVVWSIFPFFSYCTFSSCEALVTASLSASNANFWLESAASICALTNLIAVIESSYWKVDQTRSQSCREKPQLFQGLKRFCFCPDWFG